MRIIDTIDEINIINLCDSAIVKFGWTGKEYKDMELCLDWCSQEEFADLYGLDNIDMKMICKNVSKFNLQGSFREFSMGPLEIWEYRYKIIENTNFKIFKPQEYNIYFDLVTNSNNFLNIVCEKFYFIIDNKSQQF